MGYIGKKPTDAPLTSSDVADGIISNSKLAQDIISGQTALAVAPADTDEFLISDAGTLKRIDASLVGGGGITEADMWRFTADISNASADPVSANLERVDDASFAKIGTGMSVSTGVWTFPVTGLYEVTYFQSVNSTTTNVNIGIHYSGDTGSSYDLLSKAWCRGSVDSMVTTAFVNITNVSTQKVKFVATSASGNDFKGITTASYNNFRFIRLGDSQ